MSSFHGLIRLRGRQHVGSTIDESFIHVSYDFSPQNTIFIRHPGYEPGDDVLFKFFASDHRSGVAGNRRDGWLSIDRDGENRVQGDLDDVLAVGNYWYHLPRQADPIGLKWPVVRCFEDWTFPSSLPLSWSRLSGTPTRHQSQVWDRDHMSTRTSYSQALLAGRKLAISFHATSWSGFVIDDHANLMLLRSDVHKSFDDKEFVFYPKNAEGYYVHMMMPSPDLGVLYHNSRSLQIEFCKSEFLFARFAWFLFAFLGDFIDTRVENSVTSYSEWQSPSEADSCVEECHGTGANSRVRLQQENLDPADSEEERISIMKEKYLEKQRPPGFAPFKGDPFEGTADAITVFDRLGYDIIDDRDM
ncbi:hypothetical protein V1514DRAFT_321405 [Lipomyces japonicus]|uniref:uncharacterized protein n=1 Tax=Lipomyces japonicus TaxID=56871 RepID=UPI0034CF329F